VACNPARPPTATPSVRPTRSSRLKKLIGRPPSLRLLLAAKRRDAGPPTRFSF
jgi:hypothetical protein